jgi:hypothetical protein
MLVASIKNEPLKGDLRCAPRAPLSRLAGCALAVSSDGITDHRHQPWLADYVRPYSAAGIGTSWVGALGGMPSGDI